MPFTWFLTTQHTSSLHHFSCCLAMCMLQLLLTWRNVQKCKIGQLLGRECQMNNNFQWLLKLLVSGDSPFFLIFFEKTNTKTENLCHWQLLIIIGELRVKHRSHWQYRKKIQKCIKMNILTSYVSLDIV